MGSTDCNKKRPFCLHVYHLNLTLVISISEHKVPKKMIELLKPSVMLQQNGCLLLSVTLPARTVLLHVMSLLPATGACHSVLHVLSHVYSTFLSEPHSALAILLLAERMFILSLSSLPSQLCDCLLLFSPPSHPSRLPLSPTPAPPTLPFPSAA